MEDVLRRLQPRFEAARQPHAGQADSESFDNNSPFKTTENRFAALEIEESLVGEIEESSTVSPEPSAPIYELETPQDKKLLEDEKMFGIFCLLEDFWQLRDYVTMLWSEYKNGKIDLITASVTTNAAFM